MAPCNVHRDLLSSAGKDKEIQSVLLSLRLEKIYRNLESHKYEFFLICLWLWFLEPSEV